MSIARIPDLSDRRIATKVLSDLANIVGPEGVGDAENKVLTAYRMVKNSGEQVTELRIKEIVNAIDTGQVEPAAAPAPFEASPDTNAFGNVDYNYSPGNFIQRNADRLAQGAGHAGIGQPYGNIPETKDAGFGESAMDALGTTVWNFADSLLIGLPGLAYNKAIKPIVGEDSGFVNWMDGVMRADTEAGIWGERGGVAASFLVPGGLIAGVGKAGRVINKSNLVGRVFGLGGAVTRRATGFAGAVKEGQLAARGISGLEASDDIAKLTGKIQTLRKERKALKSSIKELSAAKKAGKIPVVSDRVSEAKTLIEINKLESASIGAQIKNLQQIGDKTEEIGKALSKGMKKGAEQYWNTNKKMTAKQVAEIGAEGMKGSIKSKIAASTRRELTEILGDSDTADIVLKKALDHLDNNIDDVMSGAKNLGHIFANMPGFSERVGKVLQNGLEEAIGFSTHTFLHETIKGLSHAEDYDLDTLNEIASAASSGAAHSAVTAAVFASGGGIPWLNSTGGLVAAPMKIFAPTRKTDLKTFFKSFTGMTGPNTEVFATSLQRYMKNGKTLEAVLKESRQGIKGAKGGILKKLRERGIIDYDKLAKENPDALAIILQRMGEIERGAIGDINALSKTGAYGGAGGSFMDLSRRLRLGLAGENPDVRKKVLDEAINVLKSQAEKSVNMHWRSQIGAFKHDSFFNILTGASIFWGGGGGEMIESLKRGEAHMSDIFTHALFSMTSASHGLHMIPGRSTGDPTIDSRMNASDRFLAEAQNRGVLRALGMDYGDVPFFKNMKIGEEKSMYTKDNPELETLTKRIEREATVDEVDQMKIVPEGQNIDPQNQVFTTDVRTVYRYLRDRNVKFGDGPFKILNDFLAKDKFLSDYELQRDTTGASSALALFAKKVREELVRNGNIDDGLQYSIPLTDSEMMDYSAASTTSKIVRMRDISNRAFNELQSILQRTGSKIGNVELGDLKGINVEGIDNGVARMMMNRLLDLTNTTGASIRQHDMPVVLKAEQKEEVLNLLKRYDQEIKDNFNGVGLDSPSLTLGLDHLIRSGFGSASKAVFVDNAKRVVLSKTGEEYGVAGKEEIHLLAQRAGFLRFQGDGIPVIPKVDTRALEDAGMPALRVTEIRNFIDVLRSSFGFKTKIGEALTKNSAENFWNMKTQLDNFTTSISLGELTNGIGIDFANNTASSDAEYHIMRAVTSKVSPEDYAAFNFLKRVGLIYDDPVHGRVALKLAKGIDDGTKADESILNMIEELGLNNKMMIKERDENGKLVERSIFEDYINKSLQPVIEKLIDIGVINGYAPKNTFAVLGGARDPKLMIEKLRQVAEGRRILTEEDARNQIGEVLRFFNELDKNKSIKGIDYSKVRMLSGKIINLLGKKNATAYDFAQVSRIMKRYGVFTKERNEADIRKAMEEANEYLRDQDFADSVTEEYINGGRRERLDEYDWLIGNEKSHAITLSRILGTDGLNIDPNDRHAVVIDLRKAAQAGRDSFNEKVDELYENSNSNFRKLSRVEANGLFTSLSGSRVIKRFTLGDHLKAVGIDSEGQIFEKESSVLREDIALPEGYLTRMAENLGLDIGLLSGDVKLADTNYSLFRQHDGPTEKAKLEILNNFKRGTNDELVYAPTTIEGQRFNWQLRNSGQRRALLHFGDLGNLVVIDLPTTDVAAKSLATRLDGIINIYGEQFTGAFNDGLSALTTMRNSLREGNFTEAFSNETNMNTAFRFVMMHEMLGAEGMRRVPSQIASDAIAGVVSRFRQMHSRQFTPMNRQAFEDAAGNSPLVGYQNGRLKGIVLNDSELRDLGGNVLPEGGVTRGDGQVWFHSSVLKNQARAHGFSEETVGVLKNMIIDRDMRVNENAPIEGMEYNAGTFMTKNAGAVNPQMDALMEKLGVSFIAAKSSVKLPGTRAEGKLYGEGGEVNLLQYMNGRRVDSAEGIFDIAVESLRFNKMPHESEATIGYQIENMVRSDIVNDIASAYYNAKFEGSGSVLALSQEMFNNSPEGRAMQRAATIRQLDASRFSDKVDLNREFSGSSIHNAYLEAGPYGAPGDFWFAARGLSTFKKGILQNSIFKTKEASGRQDILAADMKGILNTHEGVMAYGAREITLPDAFDGKGEFGINFAFKLEAQNMQEAYDTAAGINKLHFGYKGENHFNRISVGTNDPAKKEVESRLGQSSYVNARLFRIKDINTDQRVNGQDSFIVAAIRHGLQAGKKDGVFAHLQGMRHDSPEVLRIARALNNYVIDAIEGAPLRITLENLNVLPPKMLDALAVEATRASRRITQLGTDIPDGHHKLGKVMDVVGVVLGNYNYHARRAGSNVGKQAITWGIAGVNQRYPSARPNDTIPTIFLGHLSRNMGNQVMLNYYDSTLKGEADYDIDNYNYWFRTPKSHLGEITRLRSVAGITDTDSPRQKIDSARTRSLNPFSESDMKEYARSQERASFLRGVTIKSGSLVEKMVKDQMEVDFEIGGQAYRLMPKYKSLQEALDSPEGAKSFMLASKMVQEIIDSKKGLLAEKYMSESFDPFSEILREFYDVQKVGRDGRLMNEAINWDSSFTEVARGLISPYARLLSFSKKNWVGDSTESMTWDQMRDIVVGWDKTMNPGRNEPAMEQNLADIITQHVGGDRVKVRKVSLTRSNSMAEDAATKLVKIDNVVSTGETTELYGNKANNLSELSRYLSKADNWSSDPTPEQVAAFIGEINTKNWNVRQAINRRKDLINQIRYSDNLAAKGDNYHSRKAQILRQQYKDTTKILEAINQGKIKDPQIMHKFADSVEREKAFKNTISVEAMKLMLTNMNVDPGILRQMETDAREIRKLRGYLWSQELNRFASGHTKVYDEAREIQLRNKVNEYMQKYWVNSESYGEAAYDKNAAILQLVMPSVDYAYTGSGNKRYFGYKNIPADLFNIAVESVYSGRNKELGAFLNELGRHYAIANQYMRGSSTELAQIIRMHELRSQNDKLIGVASRVIRGGEEVVTRANLLRNLGYGEEQINDAQFLGKFFGIDMEAMRKLGGTTPEDLLNENIAVVRRRSTSNVTVKDILGIEQELSPLVRVELRTEAFTSDRDGVILKEAEKTYIENQKRKAKENGEYFEFDPKDAKTHEGVMRQVDRRLQGMQKLILGDAKFDPINVKGGGGPEESIERIIEHRSTRQKNHEDEGICK